MWLSAVGKRDFPSVEGHAQVEPRAWELGLDDDGADGADGQGFVRFD
jgi:hypothetical protein